MPPRPVGVLALTLNSSIGGTEKSLLELTSRLDHARFRPVIAALIGDGTLLRLARDKGLQAVDLGMRGAWDARVVVRLTELIRAQDISLIHSHLYHSNMLARLMGAAMGLPVICSQRSTDDWQTALHRGLDRATQGLVQAYVANCQAVRRFLVEKQRIRAGRVHVIQGAMPVPAGVAKRDAVRDAMGLGDALVVGTVANLRRAKGHGLLLDAAKAVLRECPQAVFVWVGDGPLRGALQQRIAAEGLQGKVRLTGFQENALFYAAGFDIFVLPSLWEGLPVALMEAMAMGLAVVATDVGGVSELLADGEEGVLVPRGDSNALGKAIVSLLKDRERAGRLGQAACRRSTLGNVGRMVQQTQRLYEECLR